MNTIKFFDLFNDCVEYPNRNYLVEYGVPQETLYTYVSTTYLNGFINYINVKKVYLVEMYTKFTEQKCDIIKNYFKQSDNFHAKYDDIFEKIENNNTVMCTNDELKFNDNIVIFGESENSNWFFHSDRDCSDSSIGRISNSRYGIDLFINSYLEFLHNEEIGVLELPVPIGWITL